MTTTTEETQGTREETESTEVALGPLFTGGVVLLALSLLRRSKLAAAAGIGAIWLDQRSELGRSLRERFRAKP